MEQEHLWNCIGLIWQLELAGLVELPGLLQVLNELEQPRSTCRQHTPHTMISPPFSLLDYRFASLMLVCQALALVNRRVLAVPYRGPSSDAGSATAHVNVIAAAF